MGDESKLSALSRIILFIPIFLCITISVYLLYQYEKCLNPLNECDTRIVERGGQIVDVEKESEDLLNEETRRAKEILKEHRAANQ